MHFHPVEYPLLFTQVLFTGLLCYLSIRMLFFNRTPRVCRDFPGISIVIPFRNEAQHLSRMLRSIAAQKYPGRFEIILVNDRSTDAFRESIAEVAVRFSPSALRIIDSESDPRLNLTSKQQAIEKGVSAAAYPWIALTDADMTLHPDWLSSLMSTAQSGYSLVFGHTVIEGGKRTLFNFHQAYQLEFLFTTAFSFHTAGLPGSCMGNNLLVEKNAYTTAGGQRGIGYSIVEDLDLLRIIRKAGYASSPAIPFYPTAGTYPCATMRQFFYQALRWLKGGLRQKYSLVPVLILLGIQNFICIAGFLALISDTLFFLTLLNVLIMGIFLQLGFRKIHSRQSILGFPLYYAVMILQTLILLPAVFCVTPEWKSKEI